MNPLFYLLWYSGAALLVVLVWGRTARLRSGYVRLAIRLAAVALGFTTVPPFGPEGGPWFPIGLYYLRGGSAGFAAWGTATLFIASVWFLLFFAMFGLREAWAAIHPRPDRVQPDTRPDGILRRAAGDSGTVERAND